jgi:hypothetical protein
MTPLYRLSLHFLPRWAANLALVLVYATLLLLVALYTENASEDVIYVDTGRHAQNN